MPVVVRTRRELVAVVDAIVVPVEDSYIVGLEEVGVGCSSMKLDLKVVAVVVVRVELVARGVAGSEQAELQIEVVGGLRRTEEGERWVYVVVRFAVAREARKVVVAERWEADYMKLEKDSCLERSLVVGRAVQNIRCWLVGSLAGRKVVVASLRVLEHRHPVSGHHLEAVHRAAAHRYPVFGWNLEAGRKKVVVVHGVGGIQGRGMDLDRK